MTGVVRGGPRQLGHGRTRAGRGRRAPLTTTSAVGVAGVGGRDRRSGGRPPRGPRRGLVDVHRDDAGHRHGGVAVEPHPAGRVVRALRRRPRPLRPARSSATTTRRAPPAGRDARRRAAASDARAASDSATSSSSSSSAGPSAVTHARSAGVTANAVGGRQPAAVAAQHARGRTASRGRTPASGRPATSRRRGRRCSASAEVRSDVSITACAPARVHQVAADRLQVRAPGPEHRHLGARGADLADLADHPPGHRSAGTSARPARATERRVVVLEGAHRRDHVDLVQVPARPAGPADVGEQAPPSM